MPSDPEKKREIVDRLTVELQPVRRFSTSSVVSVWFLVAWAFVCLVTFATGDPRPGVIDQLQASPRFVLECLLGVSVGLVLYRFGVLLATPGAVSARRAMGIAVALVSAWFGAYLYGLVDPTLEPSMIGKRPHCFIETFMFSSVPILLGFWLVFRRLPLARGSTGALVGAASASIPATIMQIACMYDPRHILQFHLVPVLIVGGLGAVAGWVGFRKP